MNKLLGFILLIALVSCTEDDPTFVGPDKEAKHNVSITGVIQHGQNQKLRLETVDGSQKLVTIAKATADGEGKFTIDTKITGASIYQLRMGDSGEKVIPLTIMPNDKIKLKTSYEQFGISPKIEGTQWSDAVMEYMNIYAKFNKERVKLAGKKDKLSNDVLNAEFAKLMEPVDTFALNFMAEHPENPFNMILIKHARPKSPDFSSWDPRNMEILNAVAFAFETKYPDEIITNTISNEAFQTEVKYNEYIAKNSGTIPAQEMLLSTPEGKEIALSSLRGKYVLIDFWASWCAPCRNENPNVVKLYKKYKDQGFTVYSVSLDDDPVAWKKAIVKDGLIWPNHVSDLKGQNSSLPKLYNFTGIPHTVLLNKEGNIIGSGLRGESLEQKLKEIFSN